MVTLDRNIRLASAMKAKPCMVGLLCLASIVVPITAKLFFKSVPALLPSSVPALVRLPLFLASPPPNSKLDIRLNIQIM